VNRASDIERHESLGYGRAKNGPGTVRVEEHIGFGKLQYRARCIDFDSKPDEILAYVEKRHRATLLSDGYVVLQLDGNVQWMDKQEFKKLLAKQQKKSPEEMQMLQNN